jgi:hypothetical protein
MHIICEIKSSWISYHNSSGRCYDCCYANTFVTPSPITMHHPWRNYIFARITGWRCLVHEEIYQDLRFDCTSAVWTSLGPPPRWVPGPTSRWAPRNTWLGLHGTCWRGAQGPWRRSTRIGSCACPTPCRELLDIHD